ncbi:MAG: alanine--glyoxylate aminotransferase family protein [Gammaproteobacteria bacterium]|nr:alanine--glyoxylate aminotransferase family protein [Gammaproteobacteria bacterium]
MSEVRPGRYRLRLPGPTAVPERVLGAIARPVLSHRGAEFRCILAETVTLLRDVLGTAGDPLLFAASGTGVMEAALANVLAPGDRVLVLAHGRFGERFAEIAATLGAAVDVVDTPWGEAIDLDAVASRLTDAEYRAVVVVHNESSTGVVADLRGIGALLIDHPALLVVDSVSGAGGIDVRQDEWGVDILVTASQKALMCPPGLGVVSVSEKAWASMARHPGAPRVYFDLSLARNSAAKGETPFTPPTSLVEGLREALTMIHEEGLDAVLARHARMAAAMREGAAALGLESFPARDASATVSVLRVPADVEGGAIVRHMYERFGTVIAGARNKLSGKVIRIGTMGACSDADIAMDVEQLEATLGALRARRSLPNGDV